MQLSSEKQEIFFLPAFLQLGWESILASTSFVP